MGRFSRAFVATLMTLAVSIVVAEMVARWVFGLQLLHYRWPYQPLFVTGDYQYLVPNDRLALAPGGPDSLGYKARGFGFYTSPEAIPASSTPLSDFLFSHERSRYPAAEVDRITCAQPDAILIYALGGSVAQGFSASGKETTWHAVLETRLRETLGRQDVYVFNAAMGGFVSLQERLAFHLAVAPRNATLAIVLDGYNDVIIPANSAVRPGDPWQLGLRFSQFYGDGLVWWLSTHSAILHTLMQNELEDDVLAFRRRLERDDALFARHARSIAGLYTENMNELLTSCAGRKLSCFVAIQPGRAMSAAYSGVARDDILSQKRMVALYDTLKQAVAASPQHDRFVDLTHLFDGEGKLALYKDSVHPGDEGQALLGEALLAPTLAALASATQVKPPPQRCERMR
ncbi:MAG: SGNH/GDSL hydrolase family protein [Reyranella sp.]|uniref:SGNH/GDSL hydrolase family protein n=1 Tax=Reyranella sp. TaxID=1929291 RepID=UPI001AC77997|nr:SGNH/GDSL hydrolase family protein [Reyranella sp.]MBN9087546.1 SGNH/GDSL hydrolase family protein [Reyranella sp.]